MTFDDSSTDSQAHSGSGVIRLRVQPFEGSEDAFCVLLLESVPIILYDDAAYVCFGLGTITRNSHMRRYALATELDRVHHQVIEKLTKLTRIYL